MKTHNLTFIALFATILIIHADEQPPTPTSGVERRIVRRDNLPDTQTSTLKKNYVITIKGALGKSEPVDTILRGSSTKFSATLENPNRRIEIVLSEDAGSLAVAYSLGARIPISTGASAISYQNTNITGSFLATLGEPFPILEVGDSRLTIQIDQVHTPKK